MPILNGIGASSNWPSRLMSAMFMLGSNLRVQIKKKIVKEVNLKYLAVNTINNNDKSNKCVRFLYNIMQVLKSDIISFNKKNGLEQRLIVSSMRLVIVFISSTNQRGLGADDGRRVKTRGPSADTGSWWRREGRGGMRFGSAGGR